ELLQRVWGRRATHRDRTVDVFVRKLREKIDRRAPRHTFIHTRYGVGYKLGAEPKWSPAARAGGALGTPLLRAILGVRERGRDEPGNGRREHGYRSDIES